LHFSFFPRVNDSLFLVFEKMTNLAEDQKGADVALPPGRRVTIFPFGRLCGAMVSGAVPMRFPPQLFREAKLDRSPFFFFFFFSFLFLASVGATADSSACSSYVPPFPPRGQKKHEPFFLFFSSLFFFWLAIPAGWRTIRSEHSALFFPLSVQRIK